MAGWDEVLTRAEPHQHLVQFYNDDESLLVTKVAHYFREGWRTNGAAVAIGTARRNEAIADELNSLGIDVAAAVNSRRLLFFDAEETVRRLTVSGTPQWSSFDAIVGSVVRELRGAHAGVRAYGEMVGVLWTRGDYAAAARLEEFWNRLLAETGIALFCAYPIDMLGKDFDREAVETVIRSHTHVLPVGSGNLDQAVEHAMKDVLGERAEGLRNLVETYFRPSFAAIPKPEGMVLWLRHNLPQYADQIIARARAYYRAV